MGMTDKTLPERMREAADVLTEVAERDTHWLTESAALFISGVHKLADEWEREDAEKVAATAKHDAEVEELAQAIYRKVAAQVVPWDVVDSLYREMARSAIAAGWRKQDPT